MQQCIPYFQTIRSLNMKKTVLAVLTAMTLLSACNTVSGFGKDVSKAGDKLEQTADRHGH